MYWAGCAVGGPSLGFVLLEPRLLKRASNAFFFYSLLSLMNALLPPFKLPLAHGLFVLLVHFSS